MQIILCSAETNIQALDPDFLEYSRFWEGYLEATSFSENLILDFSDNLFLDFSDNIILDFHTAISQSDAEVERSL